jgi:methylmalonyl-CoA mutase
MQHADNYMVQQLAYSLAHANEYFNRIPDHQPIVIQVAVGTNYFFEIAKLRALRLLKNYNYDLECHLFWFLLQKTTL